MKQREEHDVRKLARKHHAPPHRPHQGMWFNPRRKSELFKVVSRRSGLT